MTTVPGKFWTIFLGDGLLGLCGHRKSAWKTTEVRPDWVLGRSRGTAGVSFQAGLSLTQPRRSAMSIPART